jgi:hypothetical protein
MRNVIFALAILALTTTTASAQSSGPGGYGSAFGGGLTGGFGGLIGGYQGPAFGGGYTARRVPQVNRHAGGCDSTCQAKCQGAWRALGFRSVNACVARWAKLIAEGTAATCETAIKANGMRPVRGC